MLLDWGQLRFRIYALTMANHCKNYQPTMILRSRLDASTVVSYGVLKPRRGGRITAGLMNTVSDLSLRTPFDPNLTNP